MYTDNCYSKIDNISVEYWRVGIYCRLSKEDEGTGQSESINNQREFLKKYVNDAKWTLFKIYIDDGYSGLNFERPGFQDMINDIESGLVNLIIVKDLSRLGRDYIQTGYYLEKYFPEKRVRFIAVNDCIDTFRESAANDFSPIRSVFNDMYAKDISKKVRTAFNIKRAKGQFIGSHAPFGYLKDPDNKNKIIVDEEAARIVKRIFEMYLGGMGLTTIAYTLNEEGVPNPSRYKKTVLNSSYVGRNKTIYWDATTIRWILTNPTYMGSMAQGKSEKLSYKSKKFINIPRENWQIVEGTHEPIISKQEFETVQKMIERKNNQDFKCRKTPRLFSGFVYCGDCGSYMTYNAKRNHLYLICSTYKRFSKEFCSRHSIQEKTLISIVIEDMVQMIQKYVDVNGIKDKTVGLSFKDGKKKEIQDDIKRCRDRLEELKAMVKSLYTDKVKGIISEEDFLELNKGFTDEKSGINEKLQKLEKKLAELDRKEDEKREIEDIAKKLLELKTLDRFILEKLIEKIEIYENAEIKIHYKFLNPDK